MNIAGGNRGAARLVVGAAVAGLMTIGALASPASASSSGWESILGGHIGSGAEGTRVANAAKHSEANKIKIDISERAGVLVLRICDDGDGGADPARGSGLSGLAQRVDREPSSAVYRAATETIGCAGGLAPNDPAKAWSENEKMPPSSPTMR